MDGVSAVCQKTQKIWLQNDTDKTQKCRMERKTWNPPLYPPIRTRTSAPWQLLFQLFSIWQMICNKRKYKKSLCSLQCDIWSAICSAINKHQFMSRNMDTLNVSWHWLFYSARFVGTTMLKHLHHCVSWTNNLPHISAEIVRTQLDQASSMVASKITWSTGYPHKHTHTLTLMSTYMSVQSIITANL